MMQGDKYSLAIEVLNNAGQPVTPVDITDLEIVIGHIRKSYREQQLSYHDGLWLFPLTQEETFGYAPYPQKAQVRVYWANGVIEGKPIHGINVSESASKEVL